MSHDSIIDEVRAIRDAIAREHNYDLDSIFRMLRTREAASERLHVILPPKLLQVAKATEPEVAAQQGAAPDGRAKGSGRG
ncbi:MAG: hypothetical protein Q7J25_13535 [Vicinamibacterales bacterium]|nr:hypothetical protein [Vicinamibacterales bacterium]